MSAKKTYANFDYDCEIEAVAADGEEIPSKFNLVANTGVPMRANGFADPVIIDMTGVKFSKTKTPILVNHDVNLRFGHTTSQTVEPTKIVASVMRSSAMGISDGIAKDMKAGFPFQVSVGADIVKAQFVREGDSVEVNGKSYSGPLLVAKKTLVREISLCVLGADSNTSASIAANLSKENDMDFEAWVKAEFGLDVETLSDDQKQKLRAKYDAIGKESTKGEDETNLSLRREKDALELERQETIKLIARKNEDTELNEDYLKANKIEAATPGTLAVFAVSKGWSADKFELELRRATKPSIGRVGIHTVEKDVSNEVLECAVVRQFVTSEQVEASYGEKVLEASDRRDIRRISLHQLMDMTIRAATGSTFSGNRKSDEFIEAARSAMRRLQASGTSTLSVSNILEDAAHKLLWSGYQSRNTVWEQIARVIPVNDFKTHNLYRLTMTGGYQQVGADGELKHGSFSDQKFTVAANTYGKIVGLTRRDIRNDDLNAFNSIMGGLGVESARAIEEIVFQHMLSNRSTIFSVGNKNTITGAGSDLTVAGLTSAAAKFMDQVDSDNAPLLIEPDRILVGTQDAVTAGTLYTEKNLQGLQTANTKGVPDGNPFVGRFRPIVSPYLNNTNIKQRVGTVGAAISNQDANQWFMFCDPSLPEGAVLNVALLDGNRVPFLESSDADFNVLGMQWRSYHDFGVGSGEPKLGVYAAGA